MLVSMFEDAQIEEELYSSFDFHKITNMLRVHQLNILKQFSEPAGVRVLELDEIIHASDLNAIIRIAYEWGLTEDKSISKTIEHDDKKDKGLTFFNRLEQFVEIAKSQAQRSRKKDEKIHIYTVNKNVRLPVGLAFNKEGPGKVFLIVTKNMSWRTMLNNLGLIKDNILDLFKAITILR